MTKSLSIIIEPNELAESLDNNQLLIIDLRAPECYQNGHVPNAVNMALGDVVASAQPTGGLLPDNAQMTSALQRIGYTPDKHIVAIDDNGGPQAARLIWTLHAFGITQCSFLNGGMAAWMDDINETDQTIEAPEASSYEATLKGGNSMSRQQIIDQLDSNLQIVDARTLGEFNGEDIRSERGGHVPNAIHFEWSQIKNKQTMKLKPLDEIAALFEQAGIKADKETVSYCQTHMRSSVLWMVMTALGFENPKGYPGAWSDWGNQSDTPIA